MAAPEQDSHDAREAYALELARDLHLDIEECRLRVEPLWDEDVDEGREQLRVWRAERDEMRRLMEGFENVLKCQVSLARRSRIAARTRSRESHRGRTGHRRSRAARGGPDPDEPEPALRLAPPPKAIYSFACLSPEQRGEAW